MDQILNLCGATPDILPYAKEYCTYILPGYFIFIISAGLNNFIRSSGKPKTAMATQFIIALANIICTPVFIYIFHWGLKGAALAIVAGDLVSTVWIMAFFLGKRAPYRLNLKNLAPKFDLLRDFTYIGFAQFIFQLSVGLLNIILNHSLIKYAGDLAVVAVSAMGIVISINTIFTMPVVGISQGAQPLIGYNHGARKYKTAIQTLKMAIRWATVVTVTGFLIIQLFPRPIVSIFNAEDGALINMSSHVLRIFNLVLPLVALPIMTTSFFQAINKPLKAAVLSLSRQILILIPLVLILPLFFGLSGVFFAPPVADALSTILAVYLLKREFAKHRQNFFLSKKYK
jgi:putative MATE family efflux protein